jgi:hypothetical protein
MSATQLLKDEKKGENILTKTYEKFEYCEILFYEKEKQKNY